MYFYFLTIDKVLLDKAPSREELLDLRNDICLLSGLKNIRPYQVHCFEWKDKGRKFGRYLHYHCILASYNSFIKYKDVKRKGYSIKLEKLDSRQDIARVAGYIQKYKKDDISKYCIL